MSDHLFLIRHAHRHTSGAYMEDNGLSEKGLDQAQKVALHLKQKLPALKNTEFWCSPKLRCQETLAPFLNLTRSSAKIISELDEGPKSLDILEQLKNNSIQCPQLTLVICSHGDFLPQWVNHMCHSKISFSMGSVLELTRKHNTWIPVLPVWKS